MSAHTPGPWSRESYVDGANEKIVIRGDGLVVAEIECHHESVTDSRADARLIAAAPSLLAALQGFLAHYGSTDEVSNRARAAIAKATGAA